MSIRIHALAKQLNVPSKELIEFINQRKDKYGLEIKTSSNAIAPLYAKKSQTISKPRQRYPTKPNRNSLHSPRRKNRKPKKLPKSRNT